jgi:hypothetical protein
MRKAYCLALIPLLTLHDFPRRFDKSQGNNALLAASAPFTVQDKCVLEAEEACYCLSIESAMPIFAVSRSDPDLIQMRYAALIYMASQLDRFTSLAHVPL